MPVTSPTQIAPQGPSPNGVGNPFGSVTIIVTDENGANLSQQALVKLYSNMTSTNVWGTTQDRSQIIFDQVPLADYEVEVSSAGYETTTKELSVMTAQAYQLMVRLKLDGSGAVTNPIPGQLLAPKARKEVQKGISGLNSGNLSEAQKHLQAAYKLAPANADLDYLLGFLFVQKKDPENAQTYLEKAISLDPHHVRALTTLGQLEMQQKDYPGAVSALEQVVATNPGLWTGHSLLAEAYLQVGDFDKALEQADLAKEKGKTAAVRAEVIKGEALAHLGKNEEAIQVLEAFVKEAPKDPVVPGVRDMIAQLKEISNAPTYKETSASSSPAPTPALTVIGSAIASPTATSEKKLSIPLWRPPSVDDEKATIASGVVCPSAQVITGAGKRATELVDNVARFEATEDVLHQELDEFGNPVSKETRKFDYIASISENRGALAVDEYRGALTDQGDFPAHIATRGLPGLAMVFHPLLRDDYQMTCEGLGDWHGQAAWLVYFRQRPDRPSRMMRYSFTDGEDAVALKGRAWIAASTFQIVHLEADLLNPMPRIRLLSQHQSVDYGAVAFKTKHINLWLPKDADLYFDFRGHRYHRNHTFENYKLFSVGASQKIEDPKEASVSKESGTKAQD